MIEYDKNFDDDLKFLFVIHPQGDINAILHGKGFDMKTGKLSIHPNQNRNDQKSYTPVTFLKTAGNPGGKLCPVNKDSTRLQELSLMNKTYFGATHYDIHLDMKFDYAKRRIFKTGHYPNKKHFLTYVNSYIHNYYNHLH